MKSRCYGILRGKYKTGGNIYGACTKGTVISTNRLWWLKINKKPIRTHLLDGADFPTVITVQYSVSGVNYKKKKILLE